MLQQLIHNAQVFAYVLKRTTLPTATTFITPPACNQQVGHIVYKAGQEVMRHRHCPIPRVLAGTTEVLYVLQGQCVVDFYDAADYLVIQQPLTEGDLIVIIAGGHGIRMLTDTVLLEVKQGPYPGVAEKEHF